MSQIFVRAPGSPTMKAMDKMHVYEVRPRKDKRGVDLISDALPFGRLWYGEPGAINNGVDYAESYSRSHDAVIRVYDAAGNVIEAHEHKARFQGVVVQFPLQMWYKVAHARWANTGLGAFSPCRICAIHSL
jgi:hypothetical protein